MRVGSCWRNPEVVDERATIFTTPPDAAALLTRAWVELRRVKRRQTVLVGGFVAAALVTALPVGGVSVEKLVSGLPQITAYVGATLPRLGAEHLWTDLSEWYWGIGLYLRLLWTTVLIAYAGTLLGLIAALALAFPASANLTPHRVLRFACRRVLEIARSVPELVYALIFVFAFGIGALPGVLAIAVHSAGALGKLFSEANENLDERALEGVTATGNSWFAVMRYAVLPQVLPNYASYALFRFEINVRSASVLGFVGAGGIGQELYTSIRSFAYTDVSAVVLTIIAMVSLTDVISEAVRSRLIGRETLA
jgi:phosphonate transport system permease protein